MNPKVFENENTLKQSEAQKKSRKHTGKINTHRHVNFHTSRFPSGVSMDMNSGPKQQTV